MWLSFGACAPHPATLETCLSVTYKSRRHWAATPSFLVVAKGSATTLPVQELNATPPSTPRRGIICVPKLCLAGGLCTSHDHTTNSGSCLASKNQERRSPAPAGDVVPHYLGTEACDASICMFPWQSLCITAKKHQVS